MLILAIAQAYSGTSFGLFHLWMSDESCTGKWSGKEVRVLIVEGGRPYLIKLRQWFVWIWEPASLFVSPPPMQKIIVE